MRFRWLAVIVVTACAAAPPRVELVESTPLETSLDHPAIPDAAAVWVEMIDGARAAINIAQFYVSDGPALEPTVRALERAIARGVRVRVVVEASFVAKYPDTLDRLARAGAAVRHLDLHTGGILHAKYFIVDGRDAFLGSQNFDWRALAHNLELGARIRDRAVAEGLEVIFARDWAQAGGEPVPSSRAPASILVASPKDLVPPGLDWELPHLVALLAGARHTIQIQLLTYRAGEWTELEAPLRAAAARGVAVELLVADWSKRAKTLPGLQELARVPNVEIRFAEIPPATTGFIPFARVAHAKLLVVDGARGWLGTSNWEREYFYQSRNVGLLLDDARGLASFFHDAWTSPYAKRVDLDATYEAPRIDR